jgi:hypothetical protein
MDLTVSFTLTGGAVTTICFAGTAGATGGAFTIGFIS